MDLYYRAPDILELLAHRAAELAGLYQEAGVEVTLKDGSGAKWFAEVGNVAPVTIGVGGATYDRLVRGMSWAVVCVNTQYPMFWLIAQPSVGGIAELNGKRVAGLPIQAAPVTFLRIVFRQHGLDLLRDCSYMEIGDTTQRVELLKSGAVDAIQLGSNPGLAPFALERSGFRLLAFVGEEFQASATGLAVNPEVVAPDDPQVLRMVTATRNALARLHADRALAVRAIRDIEKEASQEDAELLYDRYIQPYWTQDGRPDRQLTEASLREMARELGVEKVPAFSELYKIP